MNKKLIFLYGITPQELANEIANCQKPIKTAESAEDDLITRAQACKILNINLTTLWKHTKSGRLKSFGIGKRVYYSKQQVLEAVKPINH